MQKFFHALLTCAAVVLLSSCFEISHVVVINKDGTATIEETALINPQVKSLLANQAAQGADSPSEPLDQLLPTKEMTDERAKSFGEGVTVKSRDSIKMPNGREGLKVVYDVPDIRKLKYQPLQLKDRAESKPVTFELSGDTVTVNFPDRSASKPDGAEPSKIPAEQLEAQLAALKPLLTGMRLSFKVRSGSGLANTDATYVEGDSVTVVDVQVDKLLEKPEGVAKFRAAQEEKEMTAAKAAELFKGLEGVKIEDKKSITLKLK